MQPATISHDIMAVAKRSSISSYMHTEAHGYLLLHMSTHRGGPLQCQHMRWLLARVCLNPTPLAAPQAAAAGVQG
jgi:hypothetical protein